MFEAVKSVKFYSGKELFKFKSNSHGMVAVNMMTDCLKDFKAFLEIMCDRDVINETTSLVWSALIKKKI